MLQPLIFTLNRISQVDVQALQLGIRAKPLMQPAFMRQRPRSYQTRLAPDVPINRPWNATSSRVISDTISPTQPTVVHPLLIPPIAGNGTLAGTSLILFTPSATLAGTGALAGSSSLLFSPSGTVTGKGALVGSSALVFSHSATLTAAGTLVGSSAISFSATGTLAGRGALVGTAAIVFASSGTLSAIYPITGTSSLAFSLTGTLIGTRAFMVEASPATVSIMNEAAPELIDDIEGGFDDDFFDPAYFDTGGVFERESEPATAHITQE